VLRIQKPFVTLIVCGRFHYHKYVHLLSNKGLLDKFVYSYKINFDFNLQEGQAENHPLKEYLMYAGAKLLKGMNFYKLLSLLHNLWQQQVLLKKSGGNIAHFLVHGNCYRIMEEYKKKGIIIIGEVVNVHPKSQEELLQMEYNVHKQQYSAGEKVFGKKIIIELEICDYLLAPSSFIRDSLIAHGVPAAKIKVLPYGIEDPKSAKANTNLEREQLIRLLFVGKITYRKGVIYLLKAFKILRSKGLQVALTLIGSLDNSYLPVIKPYLNIPGVKHIEHIDNNAVPNVMREHDLLVVPSIEDGFGVVVAEALSVNLPVIVTKNCGASEIVRDGINGFVIDAFSEEAISYAVLKSIGHTFDCTIENASWDDYTLSLTDFYCETLLNR
jgi:glycosyltransferase involved in cell wall biosynthesis